MKLNEMVLDYELIALFDIEKLKKYCCIPIKKDAFYVHFYVFDLAVDYDSHFNVVSKLYESSAEEILFFLEHASLGLRLQRLYIKSLKHKDNQENMITFFHEVLSFAYLKKCSDIHFESNEKSFSVRLRIDGILKRFYQFEKNVYSMISSIIKQRCNLDITQNRKALNGRFTQIINDKKIDFRVSTLPTIYGESIVLRLLDEEFEYQSLLTLGLSQSHYQQVLESIHKTQGLILITGPTGSGKTTTLYSILHYLNSEVKKMITIEDPIEYQIKNIQQIKLNQELGLGFNEVLKHVLRQDPDVIMIGEIRDEESLQIALQASLTGHLVLSTLHTNDAASTLSRLFDLRAKPYIVASALSMIVSQRLVLKTCTCENGCFKCNYTGFSGRTSICEILSIDENIAQMIHEEKSNKELMTYAKNNGFKSIIQDAQQKVAKGLTTKEQVAHIIGQSSEKI